MKITNENREDLQNSFIERIIDGMDVSDLCTIVAEYMERTYEDYSDEQLEEEIQNFYPDLLEE